MKAAETFSLASALSTFSQVALKASLITGVLMMRRTALAILSLQALKYYFGLFAFHVIFPEDVLIVEVFSKNESKSVSSGSREHTRDEMLGGFVGLAQAFTVGGFVLSLWGYFRKSGK